MKATQCGIDMGKPVTTEAGGERKGMPLKIHHYVNQKYEGLDAGELRTILYPYRQIALKLGCKVVTLNGFKYVAE